MKGRKQLSVAAPNKSTYGRVKWNSTGMSDKRGGGKNSAGVQEEALEQTRLPAQLGEFR